MGSKRERARPVEAKTRGQTSSVDAIAIALEDEAENQKCTKHGGAQNPRRASRSIQELRVRRRQWRPFQPVSDTVL